MSPGLGLCLSGGVGVEDPGAQGPSPSMMCFRERPLSVSALKNRPTAREGEGGLWC